MLGGEVEGEGGDHCGRDAGSERPLDPVVVGSQLREEASVTRAREVLGRQHPTQPGDEEKRVDFDEWRRILQR